MAVGKKQTKPSWRQQASVGLRSHRLKFKHRLGLGASHLTKLGLSLLLRRSSIHFTELGRINIIGRSQ